MTMKKEEAIKRLEEYRDMLERVMDCECPSFTAAIESLSAETEWIPVSERLPKENEHVGNVYKYYLIQDEYGDMHVAHLSRRGWEAIESIKALGCDVLAWMPLPKPYRESEVKE